MSDDATNKIIAEGMRGARDNALQAAIELCELVAEHGGCARCCVAELERFRTEARASDQARDLLATVFK